MAFDTLKFARRLHEAGMPPNLAEAQAEALQDALESAEAATKGDIAEVRGEIAELRGQIAALNSQIGALSSQVTTNRWFIGFNLVLTAAVLGKLLFMH